MNNSRVIHTPCTCPNQFLLETGDICVVCMGIVIPLLESELNPDPHAEAYEAAAGDSLELLETGAV